MADGVIRNRFMELCEHLKNNKDKLGFALEQFESESDKITVDYGGGNETVQGWHFANFKYRGTVYIERLPGEKLALLALVIRAWLDESDDMRSKYKLPVPEIRTIKLDERRLDVIVDIDFVDEVFLAESEDGPIVWNGKTFDVAEYPVDYAEEGTVNNAAV